MNYMNKSNPYLEHICISLAQLCAFAPLRPDDYRECTPTLTDNEKPQ